MNAHQFGNLTRISKRKARKLWGTCKIHLCPCNLRPGGPWCPDMPVFPEEQRERDFYKYVRTFEWYNCTGRETGTYTAFYICK